MRTRAGRGSRFPGGSSAGLTEGEADDGGFRCTLGVVVLVRRRSYARETGRTTSPRDPYVMPLLAASTWQWTVRIVPSTVDLRAGNVLVD